MTPGLSFFISRTIGWYLARTFVLRSLAVLAMLSIVLMSLSLLGESDNILAVPSNGQAEILRYVQLRLPQIVSQFLPFSALLGTLITLVRMNQNSEIISMKAAGASAHQILAPLVAASLAIAGMAFWFNDTIVARATAELTAWQNVDYGKVPRSTGGSSNVWVRDREDLIHADLVTGKGNGAVLHGVTYYDRDGNRLVAINTAREARPDGTGWMLRDVDSFDVARGVTTHVAARRIANGLAPDRFTLAAVDPDGMSFRALAEAIEQLEAAGRPTAELRTVLWHKISSPLSTVLMPLLAGVAGFGLARSGRLFLRAVIGMALGFAYFVVDSFALAMGNIGGYPPWLAAWAPFILFLLIGEAVLIRTEE